MGPADILRALDEGLAGLLASWNGYSTGLATVLVGIVVFRIATMREPDVHPFLLARQAEHNRIRMPAESPVYGARFTERLTTGLNVYDDDDDGDNNGGGGASKKRRPMWTRGRDGDLRDVLRQALRGAGQDRGRRTGKLLSVLGAEIVESTFADLNRQAVAIGHHLHRRAGRRIAVYLPNSVELLAALFGCGHFPDLAAILIAPDQAPERLVSMLRQSAADTIIAPAGALPLDSITAACPDLRRVLWVVDEGSRHIDWNGPPDGADLDVGVWHDVVAAAAAAAEADMPAAAADKQAVPQGVTFFWERRRAGGAETDDDELVLFSQANLVAGIAGQIEALPTMGPDDVLLPADSLAHAHTLVVTLAALHCNAFVALHPAACERPDRSRAQPPATDASPDLSLVAALPLRPTVVIATPSTLLRAHAHHTGQIGTSLLARIMHRLRIRTLHLEGRMVAPAPATPGGGSTRLIIVADAAGSGTTPALSPIVLSDLRAALGTRIIYALSAAKVAGAVAQTSAFDYRATEGESRAHFGAPPRCVRYVLRDTAEVKNSDEKYQGEIFAIGPCVVGSEAGLGVIGTVRGDNTLACM